MERVQTLINKLQELVKSGSEEDMIITTQLLYSELIKNNKNKSEMKEGPYVLCSFNLPTINVTEQLKESEKEMKPDDQKTIEVLQVNEAEIEEELNQIKKNAEIKNTLSANARPEMLQQLEEEDKVRSHPSFSIYNENTDNSESLSINEMLKEDKSELSDALSDTPIKDLKKAISINDRYVFINELFNGDEATYERSIKTINSFSIYPEAEYWIRRELKLKLGWKDNDVAKQFDQLVRRRFL